MAAPPPPSGGRACFLVDSMGPGALSRAQAALLGLSSTIALADLPAPPKLLVCCLQRGGGGGGGGAAGGGAAAAEVQLKVRVLCGVLCVRAVAVCVGRRGALKTLPPKT